LKVGVTYLDRLTRTCGVVNALSVVLAIVVVACAALTDIIIASTVTFGKLGIPDYRFWDWAWESHDRCTDRKDCDGQCVDELHIDVLGTLGDTLKE
jgi:hypothetical protein